ncbi:MAG: hypothetical protein QXX35_00630 [Desulfurococcaceae archaeon]
MKKKKLEELKRARKRFFTISMSIAMVFLTILVVYMIVNLPTGYYRGRYSSILKNVFEKIQSDENWDNETIYNVYLREIFYEYYVNLYNTSIIFNQSFLLTPDNSIAIYRVFLGANETLFIETYGNDTYYLTLSLDVQGRMNLLGYAIPGNTSRNIEVSDVIYLKIENYNLTKRVILYNETYLIIYTNISKPVSGYVFVNKTPPLNLTSILRIIPVEYTIWLFQNWIRDRYYIKTIDKNNIENVLRNTRPPWEILDKSIKEITVLEACILLYRLYSLMNIESKVIAIDLDGDNELDHFAIAVKYTRTVNDYVRIMIDYILNDANIYIEETDVNVKHAVVDNTYWLILDPVYELKYVPSFIKLKYYINLGIVQ